MEKCATSERTKARPESSRLGPSSGVQHILHHTTIGSRPAFSTDCTTQPLEADLLSAQTAPHNHWKQTCFQHRLHHTTIGSRPAFSTDCTTQPLEADLLSARLPHTTIRSRPAFSTYCTTQPLEADLLSAQTAPHNHQKQTCFQHILHHTTTGSRPAFVGVLWWGVPVPE